MDEANAVLVLREVFPVGKYIDAATQSPVRPLVCVTVLVKGIQAETGAERMGR